MITPYLAQQPVDDFGSRFADLKYSAALAAATDTSLTIPGNAQRYKAIIKTNGSIWVALNAVAAAPAGAAFAATTSELVTIIMTVCREVKAGDVLHFFSTAGGDEVSVVLYAVGTNN